MTDVVCYTAIGYRIARSWIDRQWSAGMCRITSAATTAHSETAVARCSSRSKNLALPNQLTYVIGRLPVLFITAQVYVPDEPERLIWATP